MPWWIACADGGLVENRRTQDNVMAINLKVKLKNGTEEKLLILNRSSFDVKMRKNMASLELEINE